MSDNPLSGKVSLDTTDYKAGVSELNRQIRVIETGFRASAAAMGDWDKSSAGLEARQKALNSQMDLQKQKVSALTGEYQKVAAEKGKNSKAAQDLEIRINRETESLNKMEGELKQTDRALEEMGNESKTASGKVDELGRKQDEAAGKAGGFKNAMAGLGTVVKSTVAMVAGLALAVAGVAGAIGGLVTSSAKAADELVEMSAKTGLTVERLQELSYIGKQIGTESETVTTSLARMTRSMNIARDGTGDAAEAFQKLGVSIKNEATGELRNSQTVFAEAIDALGRMTNETERDAAAMAIFGRSAMELNPMIKAGGAELTRLAEEAHKVGAVMSDEAVTGLGDFNDTLDSLKAGLKGTLGELAASFLPGFKGLAGMAGGYLQEFGAIVKGSNGDIGQMASGIGGLLSKMITDFATKGPEMLQAGLGIIQGLIGGIVSNLPTMIPAAVSMVMTLVTFIIENIPMILEAGLQIIIGLANGLSQALPELIPTVVAIIPKLILILLENLPLLIEAALNIILALAQGLIAALPVLIPEIPKIIQAIFDALILSLPLIAAAALELIMTLVTGIGENLPMIGKAAGEIVIELANGATQLMYKMLEVGADLVVSVWNGLKAKADWFYGQVRGFFSGIVDSVKDALDIHSPSKPMVEIGLNIGDSTAIGSLKSLATARQKIASAMKGLIDTSALSMQFKELERNMSSATGGMGGFGANFSMSGAGAGGGGQVTHFDFSGMKIEIAGNGDAEVVQGAAQQGVMQGMRAVGMI